ncbi:MAG: DUF2961 domain-containing protein [Bacteroidales bacterium]|nr:DUF2961 domain-containing protein [Bacteroidales bacterium]
MKKLLSFMILFLIISSIATGQEMNSAIWDLSKIRNDVRSKRAGSYDRTGGNNDRMEHIKDGEKRVLMDVKGAGVIKHIWITIAPSPEVLNRNDIILRMYWDNKPYPSVESPIGPFFGQGWNEKYAFSSLPLCASPITGHGLVSYFTMPFATGAKIEIENQSGSEIDAFYFNIDYVEMDKLPADMGRFHAWFNREITDAHPEGENEWGTLGKQGENPKGEGNYLIADIKGKGHFVGVNYYVQSPSPMWYGEGDEMVFIDGEDSPSIVGTGTEDFFNSSWCPKELYNHPYFGYARVNNETGWLGRTHCYRFMISDPFYFDKSLRFTIEHGHNNCLTLDLATVAYWYQNEATALKPIPGKEERKLLPLIGPWEIHIWRDAWRNDKGEGSRLWGNEK